MLCALLPERRGRRLPTRGRDALVNRQDEDTWTASHYACYYGHAHVLEELLAQGADPAAVNLNGCGLLQFAAGQGHLCCALLLISLALLQTLVVLSPLGWTRQYLVGHLQ